MLSRAGRDVVLVDGTYGDEQSGAAAQGLHEPA